MAARTPASPLSDPSDRQNVSISSQAIKALEKPDAGLRSLDHCECPRDSDVLLPLTRKQIRTSYPNGDTSLDSGSFTWCAGRRLTLRIYRTKYALQHSTHTSLLPLILARIPSSWWSYLYSSGVGIQAWAGGAHPQSRFFRLALTSV